MAGSLHEAATKIEIWAFVDYRAFLRALFSFQKQHVGSYSFVSFAGELGLGETSFVRLVVQGRAAFSSLDAKKACRGLGLEGERARYFRLLVLHNGSVEGPRRESLHKALQQMRQTYLAGSLDRAQLEYFSEWFHPIIRELVGLDDFSPDPRWINARLFRRLLPRQIEVSLHLLERIGYIRFSEERKRWVQCEEVVATSPEVRGVGLIRYHQQMLDMAKDSMALVPAAQRSLNALTLRLSPEAVQVAKREIQAMFQRLLALEDMGSQRNDVFQIDVQMFPVTIRHE